MIEDKILKILTPMLILGLVYDPLIVILCSITLTMIVVERVIE